MLFISSQPLFLWLLSDGKRSAVLVILNGDAGMGGKDLVLYRNAQSGDFLLPCCLCPWWREISPLRCETVKMMGRSHLYFRHRYSLLQASFLFLHSSPPGGDFLIGWGIAAEGGWVEFRSAPFVGILYFISNYRNFSNFFISPFPIPNKLFSL